MQFLTERLEERLVLTRILWDGGGDGTTWLDAQNSAGDSAPGVNDEAVINNAEIRVRVAGAVNVKSLDVASALVVDTGGSLGLTGTSIVRGDFHMAAGTNVTVTGSEAEFTAAGKAVISGANLLAKDGGVISLPGAVVYAHAGTGNYQHRYFRAEGVGSRLELPNLEQISGGTYYDNRIFIEAQDGGVVDLSQVTQIVDSAAGDLRSRSIDVTAEGAASRVELDALTQYIDGQGYDFGEGKYSTLSAKAGGTIERAAADERPRGEPGAGWDRDDRDRAVYRLYVRADRGLGQRPLLLPIGECFGHGFCNSGRQDVDLPLLARLRLGGMTLQSGGTASVPVLWEIDGASFYVSGGVTLAVPAARGYAHAGTGNYQHRYFRAEGVGSRLELPNLEQISGGTYYDNRMFIQAQDGGVVDLSRVIQIVDSAAGDLRVRSIDVTAEGAASRVELDALTQYIDGQGYDFGDGKYSTLSAKAGGTIDAPLLTSAQGVNLELDGTGTIAIGQFTDFTSGRIAVSGSNQTFPLLTEATDTMFTVTGVTVQLPLLTQIDAADFYVSGAGRLTLPQATRYAHAGTGNYQHRYFRAEGVGSRLELPNLEQISGGTYYDNRIFIEAQDGGVVDLSQVTQIVDSAAGDLRSRSIDVTAEGAASRVELDALTQYLDRRGYDFGEGKYSTLLAKAGGTIEAPLLTSAKG